MGYNFHAYPTELPVDAMRLVVDALRDRQVNWPEAAHATWHVIGYGLRQWDPHPEMGAAASKPSSRDVADLLEEHCVLKAEVAASSDAIPWQLILPVLLQLAERLIDRLLQPR